MNKFVCIAVVVTMVVVVVASGPADLHKMMMENEAACKASESASDNDVALFKQHEVPTSQTGKCFTACIFEKMGVMSGGAYSRAMADESVKNSPMMKAHPEMIPKMLQGNADCEKEIGTGTDRCETGPKIMACFDKILNKNM